MVEVVIRIVNVSNDPKDNYDVRFWDVSEDAALEEFWRCEEDGTLDKHRV